MKKLALIALMLIAFPVYATHFSKQECSVNWFDQGFKEGRAGGPMRSLARMVSECPGYGYPVNKERYQAGWQQGQAKRQMREMQLCNQSDNAFAIGKSNQPYPPVCSPYTYPAFKSGYERGRAVAQRINNLQANIQNLTVNINNNVNIANLVPTGYGLYRLSSYQKSSQAKVSLQMVNDMIRQKQAMEAELFNLQMIR